MTQNQIDAFLAAVKADEQLHKKLSEAKNAESVVRVAEAAGFSLTVEQIEEMRTGSKGELSEKELESVSGGFTDVNAPTFALFGKCEMHNTQGNTTNTGEKN